jgi:hypothetical protein
MVLKHDRIGTNQRDTMRRWITIIISTFLLSTSSFLLEANDMEVEGLPISGNFAMDSNISHVSLASFIAEMKNDASGLCVSGAGDVNNDGYQDILVGAFGSDDGGSMAGQTYLFFGKTTGWSMDTNLSTADASFIGEDEWDFSSWSISNAGDVNGDGFNDILIGAINNNEGGSSAGQTYLILGKASGWSMDRDLSTSDASFVGEAPDDNSGFCVTEACDVNGEG